MILSYIQEGGHDLGEFYIDVQSGTTNERDDLKQLINDAEEKSMDIIVTKELSRLGRNVELLYQLKRTAETKGVRILTLDGKIDTDNPSTLAIFELFAWIYESESQRISDRINSVYHLKCKNGKFMGSIPPYGYYLQEGSLTPRNDYTVEVVQEIFTKFLEGWGHDKIARYLTKQDIPPPSKVANKSNASLYWQSSSVRSILTNPHYVGDLVQGRQTTLNVTNKNRKDCSEEEWIIHHSAHTPLVSREKFDAAQQLISQKAKRGRGKTKAPKHLFTNIAYCSSSGKGMWYRGDRKGC